MVTKTKTKKKELSKDGRQQVALALILLKDYKTGNTFDVDSSMMIIELAEHLGVQKELDELMAVVPPMLITERYPDLET